MRSDGWGSGGWGAVVEKRTFEDRRGTVPRSPPGLTADQDGSSSSASGGSQGSSTASISPRSHSDRVPWR